MYINGLDLLSETENISADFVHPNIHGITQIAERLTKIVKNIDHIRINNHMATGRAIFIPLFFYFHNHSELFFCCDTALAAYRTLF